MKCRFVLLVVGLLAGCAHEPKDESQEFTDKWQGRHVIEFVDAHSMSSSEVVTDATSGVPVGIKGNIDKDRAVTIFFTTHGDLSNEEEWKVEDVADQDITGIQISQKF